jgi:hypothetical protein
MKWRLAVSVSALLSLRGILKLSSLTHVLKIKVILKSCYSRARLIQNIQDGNTTTKSRSAQLCMLKYILLLLGLRMKWKLEGKLQYFFQFQYLLLSYLNSSIFSYNLEAHSFRK